MTEKSVLLIIGGGIAAYKSLMLIRMLQRRGMAVRAVLTKAGSQFVTPLSVGALTGAKCFTDLFDLTDEAEMGHIELSRAADLLVVAPATADLMAKVANGQANDLASTVLLATDKPVLFAPAMNVRMWEHAATQRNWQQLQEDGAKFVGPDQGEMACGEFGAGRMAEPEAIAAAVAVHFAAGSTLAGRHALVTAGPTHEPLDPVRYLANRSSGKQGYAIATALAQAGARVTLVSGPTNLPDPAGVVTLRVETARQMLAATQSALPADVAICAAAVADYRPADAAAQKLKKGQSDLSSLALLENPDILATLAQMTGGRPTLVIGFAAETEKMMVHAKAKKERKGCDWILANSVAPGTQTMGGDRNQIVLLDEAGEEAWDVMSKDQVARHLVARIANKLA